MPRSPGNKAQPSLGARIANRLKRIAGGLPGNGRKPALASDFDKDEQRLLGLLVDYRRTGAEKNKQQRDAIEHELHEHFYTGRPWFDAGVRAQSVKPLHFCISYPRSGMTRFLQEQRDKTKGHIFLAERYERPGLHFDKRWQPRAYPTTRIVKDHRPLKDYLYDDGYLIVRDGRDCMVSLAWMTRTQGLHRFFKQDEFREFIAWTNRRYQYGSWASHTRRLLALKAGGTKTLIRYEDQPNTTTVHEQMASKKDATRAAWGLTSDDLSGSMYEAWQNNRGESNWRQSYDRVAAKAFHETGATDMLIELGYETDANWWKQV